jgi:Weak chloroplast movement under blue light
MEEESLTEAPVSNDGGAPPSETLPRPPETAAPQSETLDPECEEARVNGSRVEIDTSAPFESVKEAVDRFGGSAVWKSQLKQLFSSKVHGHINLTFYFAASLLLCLRVLLIKPTTCLIMAIQFVTSWSAD